MLKNAVHVVVSNNKYPEYLLYFYRMKFFRNIGLGFWILLAVLFYMLYLIQHSFDIQIQEGFDNSIIPSVQGSIKPIPSSSFSSIG